MKNMNFDLNAYIKILKRYGSKIQQYMVLIFIVGLLGLYSFLVFQISEAAQKEPSQDKITEQLSAVKTLKIDQSSIDKIIQLKDQNIAVQSLFESARQNPFQEQ